MTKNEIITKMYKSKEVEELIKKIKPSDLQDDLRQYVFGVLCEKPDQFIIDIWNKNQLKYYLVKIITNSVFTDRSTFYLTHKKSNEINTETFADVIDEEDNHELLDRCEKEVNNLYWYNQEILKMYVELGTYRKVSLQTGIPLVSIHNAIQKAKREVKSKIWK